MNVKKTTIYDIAKMTDASPTAVSSVLNGSWQKRRISKALAERILEAAREADYQTNTQARILRQEKSGIVGMIVPKYDNRYFGAIAEQFEVHARENGWFPVITCTQRDPELEIAATKALLSYQVEYLIATGATDPDHISELCRNAGVKSINLDLPGSGAPSIISDNYAAAFELTERLIARCMAQFGAPIPTYFVGGRLSDFNTGERLRGYKDALAQHAFGTQDDHILSKGYSADKVQAALDQTAFDYPMGLFVNSTISMEGVVRWMRSLPAEKAAQIRCVCFDYDPFAALLPQNVAMAQQDVDAMLQKTFEMMSSSAPATPEIFQIPCRMVDL